MPGHSRLHITMDKYAKATNNSARTCQEVATKRRNLWILGTCARAFQFELETACVYFNACLKGTLCRSTVQTYSTCHRQQQPSSQASAYLNLLLDRGDSSPAVHQREDILDHPLVLSFHLSTFGEGEAVLLRFIIIVINYQNFPDRII